MLALIIKKEIHHHLLDFRFLSVFILSISLSVLSVIVGSSNYEESLKQYSVVSEANRSTLQKSLEKPGWRALRELRVRGFNWTRRPEPLSPVVFGLSGVLGQEVHIQHLRMLHFGDSPFAVDGIYALFGMMDLAFVVKIILSLCAFLVTYDTICGEKENGTLRVGMSFAVSKSSLALGKLIGSTLIVLVPLALAFLLAVTILSFSADMNLGAGEWARLLALMGSFGAYITVFAAFGLWVSAMCQRRLTSFLSLIALWSIWIFVIPNLAVRASQRLYPIDGIYDVDRKTNTLRWETLKEADEKQQEIEKTLPVRYRDLPRDQMETGRVKKEAVDQKLDEQFYAKLEELQTERRNQFRKQYRMAAFLSSISPMGSASFLTMDLARTGFIQQEHLEDALKRYMNYVAEFVRKNRYLPDDEKKMLEFSYFTFQDNEPLGECLQRNLILIVNLLLLSILGFVGAYVSFLRYDVR
jgi:ABC-type transport system involved in multi-copper enzyme maturation permease subunit